MRYVWKNISRYLKFINVPPLCIHKLVRCNWLYMTLIVDGPYIPNKNKKRIVWTGILLCWGRNPFCKERTRDLTSCKIGLQIWHQVWKNQLVLQKVTSYNIIVLCSIEKKIISKRKKISIYLNIIVKMWKLYLRPSLNMNPVLRPESFIFLFHLLYIWAIDDCRCLYYVFIIFFHMWRRC